VQCAHEARALLGVVLTMRDGCPLHPCAVRRRLRELENNQIQDEIDGSALPERARNLVLGAYGAIGRVVGQRPGAVLAARDDFEHTIWRYRHQLSMRELRVDVDGVELKHVVADPEGGVSATVVELSCVWDVRPCRKKGSLCAASRSNSLTASHLHVARRGGSRLMRFQALLGRFHATYVGLSDELCAELLSRRRQRGFQGVVLADMAWESWSAFWTYVYEVDGSWAKSVFDESALPDWVPPREGGGFNISAAASMKKVRNAFRTVVVFGLGYNPHTCGTYSWRQEGAFASLSVRAISCALCTVSV